MESQISINTVSLSLQLATPPITIILFERRVLSRYVVKFNLLNAGRLVIKLKENILFWAVRLRYFVFFRQKRGGRHKCELRFN